MEAAVLQDYERRRLLEYADSFRELADSFQNFGLESAAEEALLLKRTELPEDGNPQLAEEKMIPTEEERQHRFWKDVRLWRQSVNMSTMPRGWWTFRFVLQIS